MAKSAVGAITIMLVGKALGPTHELEFAALRGFARMGTIVASAVTRLGLVATVTTVEFQGCSSPATVLGAAESHASTEDPAARQSAIRSGATAGRGGPSGSLEMSAAAEDPEAGRSASLSTVAGATEPWDSLAVDRPSFGSVAPRLAEVHYQNLAMTPLLSLARLISSPSHSLVRRAFVLLLGSCRGSRPRGFEWRHQAGLDGSEAGYQIAPAMLLPMECCEE